MPTTFLALLCLVSGLLVSGQPSAAQVAADSGIAGQVTIGPICPVMRADVPCPDQPFAATISVRDPAGREQFQVHSGADGFFQAALPPGDYELVPIAPNPGAPPYAAPQWVNVAPGQYAFVTIQFDSGIR